MGKKRRSSSRRPAARSTAARNTAAQGTAAPRSDWSKTAGFLSVALVLIIPPFVVWPSLDEAFRLPKLYASEILAALSLVILALRLGPGTRRPLEILRHPAVLATLPLVLVAFVGGLVGPHAELAAQAMPSLALGAAVLIGWSLALDDRERWRLLSLLGVPATLLAGLVILQFHGLFAPFAFEEDVSSRIGLTSFAGGAYDLAGYLVLPFLVLQARWPTAGRRERWALGIGLVLIAYAFAVTRTLTAVLAVSAGALWLLARQLPPRRRPIVAGGLVVALVMVSLATPIGTRASKKVSRLVESGDWNRFLTGRLDSWRAAAWMWREHPIVGVGQGAYRAEFGQARLDLQDRRVEFYRNHRLPFFTHAHNEPLQVAAEGGLLGLGALVWAIVLVVRGLRRRSSLDSNDDEEAEPSPMRELWWPAMAALGILAITYFPFHVALQAFPWLLVLATVLDPPTRHRPTEDDQGAPADTPLGPSVPGRVLTAAVVVALLFVTAATANRAWRGMAREATLQQLEAQAVLLWQQREQIPKARREAALRAHLEVLDRLADDAPADVRVPMAVGGRFFMMARYDAAARAYREAAALETRAEVFLNLARSLRAAGDHEGAAEAARTVLRLAPRERPTLDALGLAAGLDVDTPPKHDREEIDDG
ncbi:MAG: O-antigen ligase family protein [Acidobacteriota bacterium]